MKMIVILILLFNYFYANGLFIPLPTKIKYDQKIVKLGKELFYDPILSKNKDISCFSCHNLYGAENRQYSIGTNSRIGSMNSPSVFNLPYKISYFWNGRATTLEEQAKASLFAKHEMANDEKTIVKRLKSSPKYEKLFMETFNSSPNFTNMLKAIAEFQITLISPNSKFDKYLRKELSLSKNEKRGLDLFISYGCVSCHNGINIGGNSYQNFGSVMETKENETHWEDRYAVTKRLSDKMVFIVPSLRNVEMTAPYFHDGSINLLKDAIKMMSYFNIGINLENDEIDSIEAFLKTLTGEIPKTFIKE